MCREERSPPLNAPPSGSSFWGIILAVLPVHVTQDRFARQIAQGFRRPGNRPAVDEEHVG